MKGRAGAVRVQEEQMRKTVAAGLAVGMITALGLALPAAPLRPRRLSSPCSTRSLTRRSTCM